MNTRKDKTRYSTAFSMRFRICQFHPHPPKRSDIDWTLNCIQLEYWISGECWVTLPLPLLPGPLRPETSVKVSSMGEIDIRGAFNKFPDFFVQTFKIVVDSWKFTMLLLYILWDDWLIFMISGSNEQLQQKFECTLLKPDLSQLVNFKNAIWAWGHFRRTIYDKILF